MSYLGVLNSSRNADLVNYIENGKALNGTAGWSAYADAAAAAPVDGTGGSPQAGLWVTSTTSPLRGAVDFNLVKTGSASRQGQGVSYDFTIDSADLAKVLTVTFDYEVVSGTYADGDVTVYIIADPSGTPQVIQPAGYTVMAGTAGIKLRQLATFQTLSNVTDYRLCLHIASASTQNYTLAVDTVRVGPQSVVQGAAISDWQDLSGVTVSGFTATSILAKYRRVGDSAEINIRVLVGGAITTASITLPNTLPIDENKLNTNSQFLFASVVGYNTSTAAGYVGGIYQTATNSQTFTITGPNQTAWGGSVPFGEAWASGDSIAINAILPIAGWSSNTVMSSDTDTRVVAGKFVSSQTQTGIGSNFASRTTLTIFRSTRGDTHSAYAPTTGILTIPVSGWYQLKASAWLSHQPTVNAAYSLIIQKNGTGGSGTVLSEGYFIESTTLTTTENRNITSSTTVFLNAGETVNISAYDANTAGSGCTILNNISISFFEWFRLSGPATIAASETVAVHAHTSTTTVLGTNTPIIFSTKEVDTHGAFNLSNGTFTVPVSGIYNISVSGAGNSVSGAINDSVIVGCDISGTVQALGVFRFQTTTAVALAATGSISVRLNAGQTVQIYTTRVGTVPSFNLSGTRTSFVSIVKQGI